MSWINLPPEGGGGSGAVDSVNGQTGDVVLTKSDIGLSNVNNTSDANKPISTATQTALDAKQATITGGATSITSSNLTVGRALVSDGSGKVVVSGTTDVELGYLNGATSNLQAQLDNKQNSIPGSNSKLVRKNSSGDVESAESLQVADDGTANMSLTVDVVNDVGGHSVWNTSANLNPSENAPDDTWTLHSLYANIDTASDGFDFGTNGTAVNMLATNANHQGTSDLGAVNLLTQNASLGNGTDPITVKGLGYSFGFGTVQANVTISDWIQGYGFQPSLNAASTFNGYINAFYDFANISTASGSYTSFSAGPNIAEIKNNNGYTGLSLNPQIDQFTGNSNFNGINISGILENFGTGGINYINVAGTANDATARYINGINVSMDSVAGYAGLQSSIVFQDLTITFNQPGDNDNYSLQYLPGGTAGSETVALNGNNIEVTIDSGVSTASQIKSAIEATTGLNAAVTVTISGVGSNPQVAAGPTNFSGGEWPATVMAANFDGDVTISGSLSFGGALSIGKLSAFASQAIVDGGGTPASVHNLISSPTVAANATVANGDTLGINTAMLLQIGANATVTSALTGVAALALPAVVTMGAGSSIDQVSGGTFAISLDVSAGGGTIGNLDLCRSIAIPNGTTTINTMSGFRMDLPFGNPATTAWGFYESPGINNYFAGNLLIGGTPGSDDTVTNASVALEIKSTTKAFVPSRMTTTQRNALTAVEGMVIYDTTAQKLQVYDGTTWQNLH